MPHTDQYATEVSAALAEVAAAEETLAEARRRRDRAVAMLHHHCDMGAPEIARTYGLSKSNVRLIIRTTDVTQAAAGGA